MSLTNVSSLILSVTPTSSILCKINERKNLYYSCLAKLINKYEEHENNNNYYDHCIISTLIELVVDY